MTKSTLKNSKYLNFWTLSHLQNRHTETRYPKNLNRTPSLIRKSSRRSPNLRRRCRSLLRTQKVETASSYNRIRTSRICLTTKKQPVKKWTRSSRIWNSALMTLHRCVRSSLTLPLLMGLSSNASMSWCRWFKWEWHLTRCKSWWVSPNKVWKKRWARSKNWHSKMTLKGLCRASKTFSTNRSNK